MDKLKELLNRVAEGEGRLVSTGDLTELQVGEARSRDLMYVDDGGLGWVMLPWEVTCSRHRP